MTALLEDVRARLVTLALVGGSTGWDCYIGAMPDGQDVNPNCIALFLTGGAPPETSWAIEYPRFNLLARGDPDAGGDAEALAKVKAIMDALHAGEAGLGASYVYCYAVQEPIWIGRDEKRRPRYSVNFDVMRNRP